MGETIDTFIEEFNRTPDIAVKMRMFNRREDVQQFIKDNLGVCHVSLWRLSLVHD